jgi:hypothetical protein
MPTWSRAFAEQAASDRDAYDLLAGSRLPSSHRLHYLQMWLEKLCKAYLWLPETGADELRTTHNVIAKVLPSLIARHWRRMGFEQRPDTTQIRQLCREIDLLHPQVHDENRRPDNAEYPWPGVSGEIEIPAKWKFSLAARLHSQPGRLLLKAAEILTGDPALFIGGDT